MNHLRHSFRPWAWLALWCAAGGALGTARASALPDPVACEDLYRAQGTSASAKKIRLMSAESLGLEAGKRSGPAEYATLVGSLRSFFKNGGGERGLAITSSAEEAEQLAARLRATFPNKKILELRKGGPQNHWTQLDKGNFDWVVVTPHYLERGVQAPRVTRYLDLTSLGAERDASQAVHNLDLILKKARPGTEAAPDIRAVVASSDSVAAEMEKRGVSVSQRSTSRGAQLRRTDAALDAAEHAAATARAPAAGLDISKLPGNAAVRQSLEQTIAMVAKGDAAPIQRLEFLTPELMGMPKDSVFIPSIRADLDLLQSGIQVARLDQVLASVASRLERQKKAVIVANSRRELDSIVRMLKRSYPDRAIHALHAGTGEQELERLKGSAEGWTVTTASYLDDVASFRDLGLYVDLVQDRADGARAVKRLQSVLAKTPENAEVKPLHVLTILGAGSTDDLGKLALADAAVAGKLGPASEAGATTVAPQWSLLRERAATETRARLLAPIPELAAEVNQFVAQHRRFPSPQTQVANEVDLALRLEKYLDSPEFVAKLDPPAKKVLADQQRLAQMWREAAEGATHSAPAAVSGERIPQLFAAHESRVRESQRAIFMAGTHQDAEAVAAYLRKTYPGKNVVLLHGKTGDGWREIRSAPKSSQQFVVSIPDYRLAADQMPAVDLYYDLTGTTGLDKMSNLSAQNAGRKKVHVLEAPVLAQAPERPRPAREPREPRPARAKAAPRSESEAVQSGLITADEQTAYNAGLALKEWLQLHPGHIPTSQGTLPGEGAVYHRLYGNRKKPGFGMALDEAEMQAIEASPWGKHEPTMEALKIARERRGMTVAKAAENPPVPEAKPVLIVAETKPAPEARPVEPVKPAEAPKPMAAPASNWTESPELARMRSILSPDEENDFNIGIDIVNFFKANGRLPSTAGKVPFASVRKPRRPDAPPAKEPSLYMSAYMGAREKPGFYVAVAQHPEVLAAIRQSWKVDASPSMQGALKEGETRLARKAALEAKPVDPATLIKDEEREDFLAGLFYSGFYRRFGSIAKSGGKLPNENAVYRDAWQARKRPAFWMGLKPEVLEQTQGWRLNEVEQAAKAEAMRRLGRPMP